MSTDSAGGGWGENDDDNDDDEWNGTIKPGTCIACFGNEQRRVWRSLNSRHPDHADELQMRVTHRHGRRRSTELIGIVVAMGCATIEFMMMIVVRLDCPKPSKRGTLVDFLSHDFHI